MTLILTEVASVQSLHLFGQDNTDSSSFVIPSQRQTSRDKVGASLIAELDRFGFLAASVMDIAPRT